jgi:hypothetical protein
MKSSYRLQAAVTELSLLPESVSPIAASELLIGGLFKAEAVAGECVIGLVGFMSLSCLSAILLALDLFLLEIGEDVDVPSSLMRNFSIWFSLVRVCVSA